MTYDLLKIFGKYFQNENVVLDSYELADGYYYVIDENNNFERLLYLSDDYGEKFIPVNIVPRIKDINGNNGSSYDRVVVCSNGYVFAASLLSNGGEFYTNPVNCEDVTPRVWLKAKPYLLYSLNSASGYMWYDETNERFMLISSTFTVIFKIL